MSLTTNSLYPQLQHKRHFLAHIMAAAIKCLFPDAQFGVGPVIENGFFYDFVLPRTLIPEDLKTIENKIKELLKNNLVFKVQRISLDEALVLFKELNQPLKLELLMDLKNKGITSLSDEEMDGITENNNELITICRLQDKNTEEEFFVDLCKGSYVESVTELRSVVLKLDKFSGTYWRGDQKRSLTMQRIYVIALETKEELNIFLHQREEAKKRDHRVLNDTVKYYTISNLVGSGLPLLQPKLALVKNILENYLWQINKSRGSMRVWTPHIAKSDLYKTSGHWDKFGDELLKVKGRYDDFCMKPMNCPHHMQIFNDVQWSYKDMPVRFFECTTVYRDEKPGQLSGLTRVRSITQDDGHIFCRLNQIQTEALTIVDIINEFYTAIEMSEGYWVRLSARDPLHPESYLGSSDKWEWAEDQLLQACKKAGFDYKRVEGEAAFYGPKLDFMFKDSLGREWQLATIQCDFNLPERFELSYINEEGEKERPVVIHRAISGSLERFMGVFIEHTAGWLPFWLAPEQIKILTINNEERTMSYVNKITNILESITLMKPLKYNELRYTVDDRNESLGKKIKEATQFKIPLLLIVGPKDIEAGKISVRLQSVEKQVELNNLNEFILKL
jgi:threonyl-tRNA synthetase